MLLICKEEVNKFDLKYKINNLIKNGDINLGNVSRWWESKADIWLQMALVSGRSPIIPLVVHKPAYPSNWPAAPSLQQGLPTNPVVTTWFVYGCG